MVGKYQSLIRRQVEVSRCYGRLTVLSFAGRNRHGNLLWNCKCSCGVQKTVLGANLLSDRNPSCGCGKRDVLIKRNTKHSYCGTPEHRAWCGMRQRCTNPRNRNYESYGGRGISICGRWEDFITFFEDMGPMPAPGYTLERKDNSGNYEPENCVWATRKEQGRNKRNVPLYEFEGAMKSVAEWAEIYDLSPETLRGRLKKGWSIKQALTKPIRPIRGVHF